MRLGSAASLVERPPAAWCVPRAHNNPLDFEASKSTTPSLMTTTQAQRSLAKLALPLVLLRLMAVVEATTMASPSPAGSKAVWPARRSATPPEVQVQAVQGLIGRLLGASYVPLFQLSISPTPQEDESSTSDHDFYTLSTTTYSPPIHTSSSGD